MSPPVGDPGAGLPTGPAEADELEVAVDTGIVDDQVADAGLPDIAAVADVDPGNVEAEDPVDDDEFDHDRFDDADVADEPGAYEHDDGGIWQDEVDDYASVPEDIYVDSDFYVDEAAYDYAAEGDHDPDHPEDDGHDYVDLPAESRIPRWAAALLVIGLIAAVILGGGYWWYERQVDPPGPQGKVVSVVVPEGASAGRIADILASAGVVENGTLFDLHMGRGDAGPFQAGTYRLHLNSSFDEAIDDLEKGPSKPVIAQVAKVTIPEGYTISKIVTRIHEKVPRLTVEDLRAALEQQKVPTSLKPAGVTSYEGLLFPATYEVADDVTAVELLTEMAAEMESRVGRLGLDDARAHIKQQWGQDLSAYDMLKVASIIQFEAAVPADAPKIATVFYNRLKQGIPLGSDATTIYEAGLNGTQPDYESDTPYNTRTRRGLPPTPIAAPGEMALDGAMQPANGDWLYFVLTDTDTVSFSVSYEEFLRNKDLCEQRNLGCG